MNKKIILFDWDDTLFSKNLYKNNLITNLARVCEITKEEALKTDDEYFNNLKKSSEFKIENFLNTFEYKFGNKINMDDFNTDKLEIYSKSLFNETIEVLEKMKDEYTLGVYTQGFESLQRLKMKFSGIENYFDKDFIFINRDKTRPEVIVKLPTGAMVIDDKKEVIETLRKLRMDLDLVWINRKDDDHFDGALTIKSLEELI